jgi:hypothetical protein
MEFRREILKENFVELNPRLQGQLHLYSTMTLNLCALSTSTADLLFYSSLHANVHSCSAALLSRSFSPFSNALLIWTAKTELFFGFWVCVGGWVGVRERERNNVSYIKTN